MSEETIVRSVWSRIVGSSQQLTLASKVVASLTVSAVAVVTILVSACVSQLLAQRPQVTAVSLPSFDVISIKSNRSDSQMASYGFNHGRLAFKNVKLFPVIYSAYVKDSVQQLSGGPAWIHSDRYDIEAMIEESRVAELEKLDSQERDKEYNLMMKSLLADRFKLVMDRKIVERPVYELVVAKGGPKFEKSPDSPGNGGTRSSPGNLTMSKVTMAALARMLQSETGRPVIDKTGLDGRYDMKLRWTPEKSVGTMASDGGGAEASMDSVPSIFTALQEQLGLKLVSSKAPVEEFVIKQIERPTEN